MAVLAFFASATQNFQLFPEAFKMSPNKCFLLLFLGFFSAYTSVEAVSLGETKTESRSFEKNYFGENIDYAVSLAAINFVPANKADFDGKNGWEAAFVLRYQTRYSVSVSYSQYDVDVNESDTMIAGHATIEPILLNVQYAYPLSPRVIPFFRGGGGVGQVTNETRSGTTFFGYPLRQEIDDDPMFHFGAGLLVYPFSQRNFSLEASYSRIIFDADVSTFLVVSGGDIWIAQDTVDLGGGLIRLGASYFF